MVFRGCCGGGIVDWYLMNEFARSGSVFVGVWGRFFAMDGWDMDVKCKTSNYILYIYMSNRHCYLVGVVVFFRLRSTANFAFMYNPSIYM